MAMVHTPYGRNPKNPKKRLSTDKLDNSPTNTISPKNQNSTKLPLDSIEALLADTSKTVKHSMCLLNQTRNMKTELKSGLESNLVKINKQLEKATNMSKSGTNRGTEKSNTTTDSQTQCDMPELCHCVEAVKGVMRHFRDLVYNEMTNIGKVMQQKLIEETEEIKIHISNELHSIKESLVDTQAITSEGFPAITKKVEHETNALLDNIKNETGKVCKAVKEVNKEVGKECKVAIEEINDKIEEVKQTNQQIIKENKEMLGKAIKEWEVKGQEHQTPATYATVVSSSGNTQTASQFKTLHSLIVTDRDKDDLMSGAEIVAEVGKIIDAKKEGIQIERIRKGKDRRVIIGFRSKIDRDKIKTKIEKSKANLDVKCIDNKDPQVVLYGVLKSNTDEDITTSIRTQNKQLIEHILGGEEDRIKVKYRKRGKDEQTEHVVLTVSPGLWTCFTKAGHLYIDVQRVRVADQSPLIQCSRCLGYGHGKRFCSAAEEKCGHCSGAHHQSQCSNKGKSACCVNCKKDELTEVDHNAFSAECPVRQKWEAIARAMVAYGPDDE